MLAFDLPLVAVFVLGAFEILTQLFEMLLLEPDAALQDRSFALKFVSLCGVCDGPFVAFGRQGRLLAFAHGKHLRLEDGAPLLPLVLLVAQCFQMQAAISGK